MIKQNLSDYEEILISSISDGGQFVFFPSGTSMLPTIVQEQDCVVLVEPHQLKKNDMVLYKRQNGQFVLHRIMSIRNGNYTMCGDNQFILEHGIDATQILAKVSEIRKANGRIITADKSKRSMLSLKAKKLKHGIIGIIRRIIKKYR